MNVDLSKAEEWDRAELDVDLLDPLHTVEYDDDTETTGECQDECPGCAADHLRAFIAAARINRGGAS